MRGGILNTRGFFALVATSATLLAVSGCGSSGGDSVTVQTGSLSKAAFIAKADAICKSARTEFLAKYSGYVSAHKSDITNPQKQEAVLSEVLETLLAPNIEKQIEQIGELGAPSDFAPEVTAFLETLQKRLDEAQEDPAGLTSSATPFKEAEDAAKQAGMNGCAESFS